jgi:hypothetical protein
MLHERGALYRAPSCSSAEPSVSEGGKLGREMADKFCFGPNFHVIAAYWFHCQRFYNSVTLLPPFNILFAVRSVFRSCQRMIRCEALPLAVASQFSVPAELVVSTLVTDDKFP